MKNNLKGGRIDFTTGNIPRLLLCFLGPLLLANVLNSIYNTVDTIIIGQYAGSVGTSAVSIGGKMMTLLTVVGTGLSGGGQVLLAQQIGARRYQDIKKTIGTLLTLLLAAAVLFGGLCMIFSRQIISWMNTPAEAYTQAISYLRITCVGLPFMFGYIAVSAVLRGMGDSQNPLIFITIAAILNLILDLVFVIVCDMGAAGTALATIIGQAVSLIVSIRLMYRKREQIYFDFRLKSFYIDPDSAGIILRLGIPTCLQGVFIQATQLVVMGQVNSFGVVQSAVYGIGDKIIHLLNVMDTSVSQAGGAVVGQNIGAGKTSRVRSAVHASLLLTMSFTSLCSAICLLWPNAIFGLFTPDTEALAYSGPFIKICVVTFVMSSIMSSLGIVTTGTGNAKLGLLAGFLDGVVLRLIFGYYFGWIQGMEVTGFFLGSSLARLAPITIHSIYYFSGAWKNKKLIKEEDNTKHIEKAHDETHKKHMKESIY